MLELTKEEVAKAILNYRSEHQLSQDQLARKLGIYIRQLNRWENKKVLPNQLSLRLLKEARILP